MIIPYGTYKIIPNAVTTQTPQCQSTNAGKFYTSSAVISMTASSSYYIAGLSPVSKEVNMTLPAIKSSGGVHIRAYYDTVFTGGSDAPKYNHNHLLSELSTNPLYDSKWQSIKAGVSITSIGTKFYEDYIPVGGTHPLASSGGSTIQTNFYKFAKNTNYCLHLLNLETSTINLFFAIEWCER